MPTRCDKNSNKLKVSASIKGTDVATQYSQKCKVRVIETTASRANSEFKGAHSQDSWKTTEQNLDI
jgi:hypothetical protein